MTISLVTKPQLKADKCVINLFEKIILDILLRCVFFHIL